jgi:hypothetical protein
MTFSEFANMLYPFCGNGEKVAEFVIQLADSIMEEPFSDADEKKSADGEYNPLEKLVPSGLEKIYNGGRTMSKKNAAVIFHHLSKPKFVDYISELTDDSLDALCGEFLRYGIETTKYTVAQKCAELFVEILSALAKGDRFPDSKSTDTEVSAELGVFPSRHAPLATAYISGGKLYMGNDSIKLSPRLSPPDEVTEQESVYVIKLFEAYSDAEQPQCVTPENLASYKNYQRNFGEQRKNYFNAIYIIETVRSKFGKEWSEQLEILKDETYEGISEVYYGDYRGYHLLGRPNLGCGQRPTVRYYH